MNSIAIAAAVELEHAILVYMLDFFFGDNVSFWMYARFFTINYIGLGNAELAVRDSWKLSLQSLVNEYFQFFFVRRVTDCENLY